MRLVTKFLKGEAGNFGVITALVLVPLIGAAGLAVDFGRALSLKAELSAAADAAAVGAVAEKSAAVAQAISTAGSGTVVLDANDARRLFFSQISGNTADIPIEIDIRLLKVNDVISSRVSYSATLPTTFMKVLGRNDITVTNVVTATYQSPAFIDFYMLLDNTPSMGIGATAQAMKDMKKATFMGYQGPGPNYGTEGNCAFACHIVSEKGKDDPFSYYNVAKNKKIPIRVDVVVDSAQALILTARNAQVVSGQYRMATYTFGEKAQDARLFEAAGLSENLAAVADATGDVKLMSIPFQNYNNDQLTSYDSILNGLKTEILKPSFGAPGSGTSRSDRQKIIFFVADGISDSYKPKDCSRKTVTFLPGRCVEPIDTDLCAAIKAKGIRMAVLYTTYLPLEDYFFWNDWVKPFKDNISAKMQECASPGYFFEVSYGDDLPKAMERLFRKIVSKPRITS